MYIRQRNHRFPMQLNDQHSRYSDKAYQQSRTVSERLASLASVRQWIFITSECAREEINFLTSGQIAGSNTVRLRASRTMNEYEVVVKAIYSGNACAIITSGRLTAEQQTKLSCLAKRHQCEIFFTGQQTPSVH